MGSIFRAHILHLRRMLLRRSIVSYDGISSKACHLEYAIGKVIVWTDSLVLFPAFTTFSAHTVPPQIMDESERNVSM